MKMFMAYLTFVFISMNAWADRSAKITFKNQLKDTSEPVKITVKRCQYISPNGKGPCLDLKVTNNSSLPRSLSTISFKAPYSNAKFYGTIIFQYKNKRCLFYMPYFSFYCPLGSNLEIDHIYHQSSANHSFKITLKSIK